MSAGSLEGAVAALRRGEVVGIPTDTVYGLAADPRLPGAVAGLFVVKGRPESTALPVLTATPEQAAELAFVDATARSLIERWWPGPLTIVLPRAEAARDLDLGGDPATIGLRCPANEKARALLALTGPLAVTSANRHGESPCHTAAEVRSIFGEGLVVLDGGTCDGEPSTVVSLLPATPEDHAGASASSSWRPARLELLRLGAIRREEVEGIASEVPAVSDTTEREVPAPPRPPLQPPGP